MVYLRKLVSGLDAPEPSPTSLATDSKSAEDLSGEAAPDCRAVCENCHNAPKLFFWLAASHELFLHLLRSGLQCFRPFVRETPDSSGLDVSCEVNRAKSE